jgi:predicted NAD/FAD-binding protein
MSQKKKIAIVGGGISGLSCAYALRNEPNLEVVLFEKQSRIGGHSHSISYTPPGSDQSFWIDTGFLVFNERTYPRLIHFFDELKVPVAKSEMSFAVSIPRKNGTALEWAGDTINTLFAQRSNLLSWKFWGMVIDILRFNALCKKLAKESTTANIPEISVEDFLKNNRLGLPFRDWYLLPMVGAIWSCTTQEMLKFPIVTLAQFCENHGLLDIINRPQWFTVKGGSREYIHRVLEKLKDKGIPVQMDGIHYLHRHANGVDLHLNSGHVKTFDEVVLACHSDEALSIIQDPTHDEQQILGSIPYKKNIAFVHSDASQLPAEKKVWAAWNYASNTPVGQGLDDSSAVCVHYLINKLQPIPVDIQEHQVIVTLNPHTLPKQDKIFQTIEYSHPMFDTRAIAAQKLLPNIQGKHKVWFCGAWTGYGFHEDGFKSGEFIASEIIRNAHF